MAMDLKKDLQDVNKALNALKKKVEKMIAAAEKSGKSATKLKPTKKAVLKNEKTMTAPDIVLGIIKRSRKGVGIETLKKKTGFQGQKLYNVLYVLKKRGKVNNPSKGIYVKA